LQSELGENFEGAAEQVLSITARGLALERTLLALDELASSIGVQYALIKGSAVMRQLHLNLGQRAACDVDVLLREVDAFRLHEELLKNGYRAKTPSHPQFHLPALADTEGNAIEIHTCLPHVSLGAEKLSVDLSDIIDQHLATPISGGLSCALLPSNEVLLAHCLAHGIAQHGYAPRSYQLMRMMADVVDITEVDQAVDLTRIGCWLTCSVSPEELSAVCELRDALTRGTAHTIWSRPNGAGRLLRHFVLGTLDPEYANALAPYEAWHVLRTFGVRYFLQEYGRATFGLANEDVDRIYGHQAKGRELFFKLARPFDVGRRIFAMAPAAVAILARRGGLPRSLPFRPDR
jgi:hypothetical protein